MAQFPSQVSASGLWSLKKQKRAQQGENWPPLAFPFVEDVFSTYLYNGNGSTGQSITNGIDLSTKGGLVWTKARSSAFSHGLVDTARGATNTLVSNLTDASTVYSTVTAFNTNGFTVGSSAIANQSGSTYASWTFRKQPKFFDVVTYTGNGGSSQTINHNLGSVPGCMIIKRTNQATNWEVYHRSLGATKFIWLNSTSGEQTSAARWNDTAPTSTQFTVGNSDNVNGSGGTYVAYLFAHNAGGFGLTGTDNAITCGSFTADGSGNATISNLGYEPQWVLIKSVDFTDGWYLLDNMRGWAANGVNYLVANTSNAEVAGSSFSRPTANGFVFNYGTGANNKNFIYIAIRRGPMRTPTTGTSVFSPVVKAAGVTVGTEFSVGFPYDMYFGGYRSTVANRASDSRLTQNYNANTSSFGHLYTTSTAAETTGEAPLVYAIGKQNSLAWGNWIGTSYDATMQFFRRAPGFFDVVCYTGTGSATTQPHNLGVAPELMIVKARSVAGWDWIVYYGSTSSGLALNSAGGPIGLNFWNSTAPTSSVFPLGTIGSVNQSGTTLVAYLFASCPGVSKIGSYTGTGALQTINCGFTGGARFVLIKRTDGLGGWFVYDSARGISSGNDPYFFLNSSAAEVTGTNYVDTTSVGFQVTAAAPAELNANGGTYLFLAIA